MLIAVDTEPESEHEHVHEPRRSPPWEKNATGRILIAEDEPRISSFLERGLAAAGFTTEVADSGEEALALARSGRFDLMVLDVGLPGLDGLEVLRELRWQKHAIPVVILTARDAVRDAVAGLDGGADDYIAKPFRFDELLARVRARLRSQRVAKGSTAIVVDDMTLDLRTNRVTVGDQEIDLSAREFALAETFFRHPGQVLSREQLLDLVWGYDFDPGSNIVDVYVGYLRRKLGKQRISSLRGMGYRLEKESGITVS